MITRESEPAILLSGASGMLGSALRCDFADGWRVLRLVRRSVCAPDEYLWNPSSITPFDAPSTLKGIQVAIHLSGANLAAHRWTPAYCQEIETSRVQTTHALATALSQLDEPPRTLVTASATGIYGDRGDEILTEDSAQGKGFLPEVCRRWEEATAPAEAAGIRVVHLRLGVVLGSGGGALGKMAPLFRLGLGGRLGSGRQWMSWIALPDVVRAIRFLVENTGVAGPVNLTAPAPVTNAEFTRALARRLHRPALLPAPAFALRLAFGQMAQDTLLASARVVPRRLEAAGFTFECPDIDTALARVLP